MENATETHEGVGTKERNENDSSKSPIQDELVESEFNLKSESSTSVPLSSNAAEQPIVVSNQQRETDFTSVNRENDTTAQQDGSGYVTGMKLYIVTLALYLSVFIVTLDRSIIATAIPKITSEFHSLDNFTWYQSAFQLTSAAFQLSYGNLYSLASVKWTFMWALVLFEIGSIICGVAPNSIALIFGRVVAGLGTSGIYSGALVIISLCVPLHKRPVYTGVIGAMTGIATISGPVLGGVLTQSLSWRWCFYINYPIGAVTLLIVYFLLDTPPSRRSALPFREKLQQFDFLGTAIFIPCVVCLLLALEWGGTTYSWSSWRIILLFIIFGLLAVIFTFVQWKKGEMAMLNFRIVRIRTMAWGLFLSLLNGSTLILMTYYLPIYFQAVKNVDATQSGVDYIPSALSTSIFSIIGGVTTQKIGYPNPGLYFSVVFMSVGIGLIHMLQIDSSSAFWIGTQVPYGAGIGVGIQQPLMAVQNTLSNEDIAIGFSILIFAQTIGGAVFVTVGQTIFNNKLRSGLTTQVPDLNPQIVLNAGAANLTSTIQAINPEFVHGVLVAYMDALRAVFLIALVLAVSTIFGIVGMPWIKLKGKKSKKGTNEKTETVEDVAGENKEKIPAPE